MTELLLYNGIIHTEWTADFNVLCYRLLGTWAELIKSQSHMCKQLLLDQNSSTFSHLIEKGIKIAVLTDVGLCRI